MIYKYALCVVVCYCTNLLILNITMGFLSITLNLNSVNFQIIFNFKSCIGFRFFICLLFLGMLVLGVIISCC